MLGGFLATLHENLPFYAIAALATANFVLAWWVLPESRPASLARPAVSELGRSFVPTPVRLVLLGQSQ